MEALSTARERTRTQRPRTHVQWSGETIADSAMLSVRREFSTNPSSPPPPVRGWPSVGELPSALAVGCASHHLRSFALEPDICEVSYWGTLQVAEGVQVSEPPLLCAMRAGPHPHMGSVARFRQLAMWKSHVMLACIGSAFSSTPALFVPWAR